MKKIHKSGKMAYHTKIEVTLQKISSGSMRGVQKVEQHRFSAAEFALMYNTYNTANL